jgi:hypothetical protein
LLELLFIQSLYELVGCIERPQTLEKELPAYETLPLNGPCWRGLLNARRFGPLERSPDRSPPDHPDEKCWIGVRNHSGGGWLPTKRDLVDRGVHVIGEDRDQVEHQADARKPPSSGNE